MSRTEADENPPGANELTADELADLVGIRPPLILRMVHLELIQPEKTEPGICFSPEVVPRVQRLVRLHYQLEVSWTSMALVLELLDRIEALEQRTGD